jgi:hypothetical protein
VIVKGRITDKMTGKGVESQVYCSPLSDNKVAAKMADLRSHILPVFTDGDGRYSLVTVPGPNLLTLQVAGAGHKINGIGVNPYKTAELDEADRERVKVDQKFIDGLHVVIVAGGSAEILEHRNAMKVLDVEEDAGPLTANLTVDPGRTLTVRLQDPDGKPLNGALASGITALPGAVLPLKDDACLVFALDPEKPRKLAFFHAERKLAGVLTVRGDEKEAPTIRLAPMAVVTGRLLDADGQPVAGVDVYTRYTEEPVRTLFGRAERTATAPRTDKEGRFRLEGIAPGAKIQFRYIKEREEFVVEKETEREPFKSGETTDLGDLRVKPRPRPE